MKSSILVTGGSGFVGKTLINKLDFSKFNNIYFLTPEEEIPKVFDRLPKNVKIIKGDITDPSVQEVIPEKIDTLLHLAAITGKTLKSEYDKVNYKAFKNLVEKGINKGLRRVLFISSIAVKFKKRNRYYYSFSKESAEKYLQSSGVDFSILRPTMILGEDSPVFKGFSMFAGLPIIPLFGGGKVKIEPIHKDDICDSILNVLNNVGFNNEIYDIGGPDKLSIKQFLKKISEVKGNKPKFIYIPMWLPVSVLTLLERFAYSFLPLTLGQLATFRNDSIAENNAIHKTLQGSLKSIDEMINDSVKGETEHQYLSKHLKECRVFTKYLIGKNPTKYNEKKYIEFIKKSKLTKKNRFDGILFNIALKSPIFTKICDAYSRFFFPNSILRKKLGTLFAILETSPETYNFIDNITTENKFLFLIYLGFRGGWFVFHLSLSILFFMPLQMLFGRGEGKKNKGENLG